MLTVDLISVDHHIAEKPPREKIFDQLMSSCGLYRNDYYLARIIASWSVGDGVLPSCLGLSEENYRFMAERHFSNHPILFSPQNFADVDETRVPEWEEVVSLLLEFRAGMDLSEKWIAEIVAAACMGLDHLWQDLGLWSRRELSEVLELNFPALANRNDKDMKWKKFIYKQLCERDGTYVCRAPSCDVCADYAVCFGPEN